MVQRRQRKRLLDRPTGDLLILMIAITVCASVLASGATITIIAFVHPEADLSVWLTRVAGLVNTLIGLLAGFLAGRGVSVARSGEEV